MKLTRTREASLWVLLGFLPTLYLDSPHALSLPGQLEVDQLFKLRLTVIQHTEADLIRGYFPSAFRWGLWGTRLCLKHWKITHSYGKVSCGQVSESMGYGVSIRNSPYTNPGFQNGAVTASIWEAFGIPLASVCPSTSAHRRRARRPCVHPPQPRAGGHPTSPASLFSTVAVS